MLGWVVSKVAGFGLKKLVMGGVMAVAGSVALWLWNDYQDTKVALALQKAAAAETSRQIGLMQRNWKSERMALQTRAAIAEKAQARRHREITGLKEQLVSLQAVEVPETFRDCPVHPSLKRALEIIGHAQ